MCYKDLKSEESFWISLYITYKHCDRKRLSRGYWVNIFLLFLLFVRHHDCISGSSRDDDDVDRIVFFSKFVIKTSKICNYSPFGSHYRDGGKNICDVRWRTNVGPSCSRSQLRLRARNYQKYYIVGHSW